MKAALSVWWNGRVLGRLVLSEHGDMSFAYEAAWLADPHTRPISRSLPKRDASFGRREARPFFAGLLPEDPGREVVARVLGLSPGNDVALLNALGGDVAGALTFWPECETPPPNDSGPANEPLADDALVTLLDALPTHPFLAGRGGLRLALAGAQTKLPVVLVDDRVALPGPGQPTTHILKPPIERFAATTENEAFVMRLAAACGLDVADAQPRKIKERTYLLVTRYDREWQEHGCLQRLHQEDFCQALGIPPERKYAADDGPTFKSGFALLRGAADDPAKETRRLLDAAVFNLIVGNADAHGKNFALLHASGATRLAPLYDLLCTVAYPQLSAKPAMKMAGEGVPEDFNPRTWEKFARNCEMDPSFLRQRVRELADLVRQHASATADRIASENFDSEALANFAGVVTARAKIVAIST